MSLPISTQVDQIVGHLLTVPKANVFMMLGKDMTRTKEVVEKLTLRLKEFGAKFTVGRSGDTLILLREKHDAWSVTIRHTAHKDHDLRGTEPTCVYIEERAFPHELAANQLGRRPGAERFPRTS